MRRPIFRILVGMFGSPKKPDAPVSAALPSSAPSRERTVIAKGVRLEGDFKSDGDVVIEGEVTGKVQAGGALMVGPDASVSADVSASDAVIAGRVTGPVAVKQRLELKETARISGDVTCQTIVVHANAVLHGKVAIGSLDAKAGPKSAK